MFGASTVTIEFEEPDLEVAVPDLTTRAVAGALLMGYRLTPGPDPNHEDVLIAPRLKRLQQIRDQRRSELRRVSRFHFLATERRLFGEAAPTPVRAFFARWAGDAALRRAIESDPRHGRWLAKVRGFLAKDRRVILASEGSRRVYGKLHGDPETLRDFSTYMEEGPWARLRR